MLFRMCIRANFSRFLLVNRAHILTCFVQKIHGSGELVIMGTNTEKPHYVLGVISCKLGNANQSAI